MNARNRVFMILGLLTLGSLVWYLLTARTSGDLKLIGTVDANEVLVSAKIPGRLQQLNVEEGQTVKAGELIAIVESDDLAAQQKAAEANVQSNQFKLAETEETERQNQGEVSSASVNAEAQVKASQAALAQAQANLEHQKADTTRTVALAKQGIASDQAKDEAVTSLNAAEAAVESAVANVAAAKQRCSKRTRTSCWRACLRRPWHLRAALCRTPRRLPIRHTSNLDTRRYSRPSPAK